MNSFPDYEAADMKMRGLMPQDWEREPWPRAFVQLIVEAALGDQIGTIKSRLVAVEIWQRNADTYAAEQNERS